MQFTDEEKKMIGWLRRQHLGWPTTRAIILVASTLCAGVAVGEFFRTGWAALPFVLIVGAAYGASYTLGSWAGRPEVSLLLKLIDSNDSDARG